MIKTKDNLAKLLATENVTVQYANVQTAMFDVKNRVITLPVFKKDLSEPLLDLFIGHEVSHALHTPLEGLHETVSKTPVLKGYLNVIEDVRIEKMIKLRYPGLKANMKKGYAELMEMDFFGLDRMGKDHTLSLIDKINLTTKVGEFLMLDFTDEERAFLDRAYEVNSWEDVVELATEIYEWSKENEEEENPEEDDFDSEETEMEDNTWSFDDEEDYEESDEQDDNPYNGQTTGKQSEEESDTTSDEVNEGEGDDATEISGSSREGGEGARRALTEENAHEFEEYKLRENATKVVNLPEDFFNGWKPELRIKDTKFFTSHLSHTRWTNKKATDFAEHIRKVLERKNKKIISLMVKEFEIKKAGSLYARARTAKTGAIDTLKLAKYQIVEDMFKKATVLPEGKNHGVVLYLDWSGSMDNVATAALEQAYIVAKFCRQVNIPHRIFLFTSHSGWNHDEPIDANPDFSKKGGNGHLIEMFNNNQRLKEFNDSVKCLSYLCAYTLRNLTYSRNKVEKNEFMNTYQPLLEIMEDRYSGYWFTESYAPYPPAHLQMGGTPLNGLLYTAKEILQEQKKQYRLDYQNLIIVTDGFSNGLEVPTGEDSTSYNQDYDRTMYTDPKSKKQYDLGVGKNSMAGTIGMLEFVKAETKASITGYYIVKDRREFDQFRWHIGWELKNFEKENPMEERWKTVLKQGGVNMVGSAYDKLLFVRGIAATGDDTLNDELIGASKGKLRGAFARNASSKVKSRFVVNEMIEGLQL